MNRQNPGLHGLSVLAGKTVKANEINIIHGMLVTVPGRESGKVVHVSTCAYMGAHMRVLRVVVGF